MSNIAACLFLSVVSWAVTVCYMAALEPGGLLQNWGRWLRDKMLEKEKDMDENGYMEPTIYKAVGGCVDCPAFWIGCLFGVAGLLWVGWIALAVPFISFAIMIKT